MSPVDNVRSVREVYHPAVVTITEIWNRENS